MRGMLGTSPSPPSPSLLHRHSLPGRRKRLGAHQGPLRLLHALSFLVTFLVHPPVACPPAPPNTPESSPPANWSAAFFIPSPPGVFVFLAVFGSVGGSPLSAPNHAVTPDGVYALMEALP